jgi:hypothetical protein
VRPARPVGGDLFFSVGFDARYSDDYFASSFGNPSLADGQLRELGMPASASVARTNAGGRALVGKNLTDEFYVTGVVDGPSDGRRYRTDDGTLADQAGFGTLPRTIQVRLSTKF